MVGFDRFAVAEITRRRFRRLYDLSIIFLVCGSHVNLESNVTPKKSASFTRVMDSLKSFIARLSVNSSLWRGHFVKRTSFDFNGLSVTCHFLHHCSIFLSPLA